MVEGSDREGTENPLATGSAYIDYCVKKGWVAKRGDGASAVYELTELGRKMFPDASINFDLSSVEKLKKSTDEK